MNNTSELLSILNRLRDCTRIAAGCVNYIDEQGQYRAASELVVLEQELANLANRLTVKVLEEENDRIRERRAEQIRKSA